MAGGAEAHSHFAPLELLGEVLYRCMVWRPTAGGGGPRRHPGAVCCARCARRGWPRRTSATMGAEDIPSSGCAPIPLLSHSARSVHYGGTRAENKPTHLVGDRKFRSDPYNWQIGRASCRERGEVAAAGGTVQ